MTFSMSLDRVHRWTTIFVFVLILLVAVPVLISINAVHTARVAEMARMSGLGVLCLVVVALLVAAAMAPRSVELTGGTLRIQRRSWKAFEIRLADISSVEKGPQIGAFRSLRLGGTGGFFGSYGLFWTKGLGTYRLYATRLGPSVLLRRKNGLPVVIAPDDAEQLRAAIAEAVGHGAR
jgi:hypothetical protein